MLPFKDIKAERGEANVKITNSWKRLCKIVDELDLSFYKQQFDASERKTHPSNIELHLFASLKCSLQQCNYEVAAKILKYLISHNHCSPQLVWQIFNKLINKDNYNLYPLYSPLAKSIVKQNGFNRAEVYLMNIIQLVHKNSLDEAYSQGNKSIARNQSESNSPVAKANAALLSVYRNILEFHNTAKNNGNFENLLQQFQSLMVEHKAYTDLFAETYVLLLLKLGKETEAINFLYQCVDDVDEEKDSGIQVPLLALQIAKVYMSKQKMVTDLVSYLLELIAKRDPGNPMVINLCWNYLSRDTRKRRRSSDTESQFDSDDNRIIHESFSLAPAPTGNLSDCLELIVVFLDNYIFESINTPTAVVKDAWKVFSEIAKKICQQGADIDQATIEKIAKLWHTEQRSSWWSSVVFSHVPVASQHHNNAQFYTDKAFVCFFFENEGHEFVRCIIQNHQRSGLLRSLISQLREAKLKLGEKITKHLKHASAAASSGETSPSFTLEKSKRIAEEIQASDSTRPSFFILAQSKRMANDYKNLMEDKPVCVKQARNNQSRSGYYNLNMDDRIVERFKVRQQRRSKSSAGSLTESSIGEDQDIILTSSSEDEAVDYITNRNRLSRPENLLVNSVPEVVAGDAVSVSYHTPIALTPIELDSSQRGFQPASDALEKADDNVGNLMTLEDYDYLSDDFAEYTAPSDTEQIVKREEKAKLIHRRWRCFTKTGIWVTLSIDEEFQSSNDPYVDGNDYDYYSSDCSETVNSNRSPSSDSSRFDGLTPDLQLSLTQKVLPKEVIPNRNCDILLDDKNASSCSDYESIDSAAVPITELLNRLKSAGADPSLSQNVVYAVSETVADPVTTDNQEKDHEEAAELELEQTLIHSTNLSKTFDSRTSVYSPDMFVASDDESVNDNCSNIEINVVMKTSFIVEPETPSHSSNECEKFVQPPNPMEVSTVLTPPQAEKISQKQLQFQSSSKLSSNETQKSAKSTKPQQLARKLNPSSPTKPTLETKEDSHTSSPRKKHKSDRLRKEIQAVIHSPTKLVELPAGSGRPARKAHTRTRNPDYSSDEELSEDDTSLVERLIKTKSLARSIGPTAFSTTINNVDLPTSSHAPQEISSDSDSDFVEKMIQKFTIRQEPSVTPITIRKAKKVTDADLSLYEVAKVAKPSKKGKELKTRKANQKIVSKQLPQTTALSLPDASHEKPSLMKKPSLTTSRVKSNLKTSQLDNPASTSISSKRKKKESTSTGDSLTKSKEFEASPSCHSSSFIPATPGLHYNFESNNTLSALGPKSKRRIVTSTPKNGSANSSSANQSNAKQSLITEEPSDESLDEWSRNLLSQTREEINRLKEANKSLLSKNRKRALTRPSKGKSINKQPEVNLEHYSDSSSKKKTNFVKAVEDTRCSDVSKRVNILNPATTLALDEDSNNRLEDSGEVKRKSEKKKTSQALKDKRNANLVSSSSSTSKANQGQVMDNGVGSESAKLVGKKKTSKKVVSRPTETVEDEVCLQFVNSILGRHTEEEKKEFNSTLVPKKNSNGKRRHGDQSNAKSPLKVSKKM